MAKIIHEGEIKVIGIETRTTNRAEADDATARILGLWQRFFQENVAQRVPNKLHPERFLAVYTDYESDEQGSYSMIIGCEVASVAEVPAGMVAKTLPASTYVIYTTTRGPVTQTIAAAWQEIWRMSAEQLGGPRRFTADFELYDARSQDPQDAVVDIYIAIKEPKK